MEYMFGRTFQTAGGQWERYEITLDMTDLTEMAVQEGIEVKTVPVNMRYLLLKHKGAELEAIELSARHYVGAEEGKQSLAHAKQRQHDIWDSLRNA